MIIILKGGCARFWLLNCAYYKTMKRFLALLIAIVMLGSQAYAAVDTAVQEGAVIIISGVVPSQKAGVNVTLLIPKNGVTEDTLHTRPLEEVVYYADETNSKKGGKYDFEVYLSADIKDTTIYVRVGEGNLEPVQKTQLSYQPVSSIIAAVEALNAAYAAGNTEQQNRDAVAAALSSAFLSLDTTIAMDDYLALKSKQIVCDRFIAILKDKPYATNTDAALKSAVSDIKTQFTIGVGLAAVDECKEATALDRLINQYAAAMAFDPAAYNALDGGAFGAEKQMVCKVKQEFDVMDEQQLSRSITAGVGMVELNKAISWSGVQAVVETYASAFGVSLDSSDFSSIKKPETFYKKCALHIPYASLSAFVSAFETNLKATLEEEATSAKPSRPTNGGGSGGGGGGSRQNVAFQPPADGVPPVNLVTPTQDGAVFGDLADAQWAAESITALVKKGVLNGDGSGNFRPNDTITRAEFVKMILTAFDIPVTKTASAFADVRQTDWHCDYVTSAERHGIVKGVSDGRFEPDGNVTREDMCVILARALEYRQQTLNRTETISFADEMEIAAYAKESVRQLAEAGVINGVGDGRFLPKASATRAQAAKIMDALLQ